MFTVIHCIKEAVPCATQNSDDTIKEHQSQGLKGRRERAGRRRGEEKKKEEEKLLQREAGANSASQNITTVIRLTPQMEKKCRAVRRIARAPRS